MLTSKTASKPPHHWLFEWKKPKVSGEFHPKRAGFRVMTSSWNTSKPNLTLTYPLMTSVLVIHLQMTLIHQIVSIWYVNPSSDLFCNLKFWIDLGFASQSTSLWNWRKNARKCHFVEILQSNSFQCIPGTFIQQTFIPTMQWCDTWAPWRLKSQATQLFVQQLFRLTTKQQSSSWGHIALVNWAPMVQVMACHLLGNPSPETMLVYY